MQAYGQAFARIYNQRWGGFAQHAAPRLLEFYERQVPQGEKTLLDLCCGTGHLSQHFLLAGYQVVGIDLSPAMLALASENTSEYLQDGQVEFILADAADFVLDQPVGFVVSTFDALNHLPDLEALHRCFTCVYQALHPGGTFIFDLNTRKGLMGRWNGLSLEDDAEITLINRAIYLGDLNRAYTRITGFARMPSGLYERFEETVFNTVFDVPAVMQALEAEGFQQAYPAQLSDLSHPLPNPEEASRVFFVARR